MLRENIDFLCGVSLDPTMVLARKQLTLGIQGLKRMNKHNIRKVCAAHVNKTTNRVWHNIQWDFS